MFELIYPDDAAPVIPAPDVNSAVARANSCSMQAGAVNVHPGKAAEYFPVIQENGMVIGRAQRTYCHSPAKPLHPVVHLHIIDRYSRLYLQKRSMKKDIQPGKWDTAVGGHVDYGESIQEALFREAYEELGFREFNPVWLMSYVFESDVEREMVNVFAAVGSFSLRPDHDEVDEIKAWDLESIDENLGKSLFTPNFEQEYVRVRAGLLSLL